MRLILAVFAAMTMSAQTYSAKKTTVDSIEVVRLIDNAHQTEVSIAPSAGNTAYELKVKGQNVFWFPDGIAKYKQDGVAIAANPFLAPWANRLDQDAFYANGKKYVLNPDLKNLRRDTHGYPIHGLLLFSPNWQVVSLRADAEGAETTSRLEFWKYPDLMAQFPFAHTIEMTHRLSGGVLEVRTRIENQSKEPMSLVIGFHSFFQVHDAPVEQWEVHIAAADLVEITKDGLPTGRRTPVSLPDPAPVATTNFDDVFTNHIPDADGRAEFWLQGIKQKVSVFLGPKYTTSIVWRPPEGQFLCIEPMSGITNGANLAHEGLYKELQSVPSGGIWQESFWIKPSGF